jgi:hypothetical protein
MRRIILMVGLALLMATFLVVSALPAIAAPPDVGYDCIAPNGDVIFRVGAGEVPRQGEGGFYKRLCRSQGGELTMTVTPESGKQRRYPPVAFLLANLREASSQKAGAPASPSFLYALIHPSA